MTAAILRMFWLHFSIVVGYGDAFFFTDYGPTQSIGPSAATPVAPPKDGPAHYH